MTTALKVDVRFPDLENALDALVRKAAVLDTIRCEREIAARVARGGYRFQMVRFQDIEMGPSGAEFRDALLITDPVEAAYRLGIRRVGEMLYARLGSEQAMIPTWQRVARLDRKRAGQRVTIIDQSWDEVGDWHAS
jgi:hypothetical protein